MKIRYRLDAIITCCMLFSVFFVAANSQSLDNGAEYQVKAAFLYQFTLFITWKKDLETANSNPLILCLMEPDPFQSRLESLIWAQTARVERRPIDVERLDATASHTHCHVLFVPENAVIPDNIGSDTVLITENRNPLETYAHITLFIDRTGRIAFEIIPENLQGDRIKIEYKLLLRSRKYEDK